MPPPTIAILAAGSMGSAVATRLTSHGLTVLTSLAGRSPSTRQRATDAGMQDVPFSSIPRRADFFLSILPPSEAESIARAYLEAYRASAGDSDSERETEKYYVDCNAVSPQTVKRIAKNFEGIPGLKFVDAGIIGGPPKEGYDPTFYASSDKEEALKGFEGLREFGVRIEGLRGGGVGVGDASALKMSYAVRRWLLDVVVMVGRNNLALESSVGDHEGLDGSFDDYDTMYVLLLHPTPFTDPTPTIHAHLFRHIAIPPRHYPYPTTATQPPTPPPQPHPRPSYTSSPTPNPSSSNA